MRRFGFALVVCLALVWNTAPAGAAQGNIFAVTFEHCRAIHVGYNRFPNGTVVHWTVTQDRLGTVDSGQFTAIGGGKLGSKTYHFVTVPLAFTLEGEPIQSHVHFSWTVGSVTTTYVVTRDPGCVALRWSSPSTIHPDVPAHYASIDSCPAGTTNVSLFILFPPGGGQGLGPFPVAPHTPWSEHVAYLGDPFSPATVTAYCNGPVPNTPPLAIYATHPITIAR